VRFVADQTIGGTQHPPLGIKDARGRVARDGTVFLVGQADDLGACQKLFNEGAAFDLVLDLLRENALDIPLFKCRTLLGH